MKEIRSLTGVRGLAALVVVIHHFNSKYLVESINFPEFPIVNYILVNLVDNGYLMVELFFILSGFVLALSYDNKIVDSVDRSSYIQFMVKRFIRIYPLYIFSVIVYFILFSKSYRGEALHLLYNMFFLELWLPREFSLNNVFWSLCAEWFVYLIFPFFLTFSLYRKKSYIFLLVLGVFIYLIAPVFNSEKLYADVPYWIFDLRMSNGTGGYLRCLGSYCLGLAAFKVYKDRPKYVIWLGDYWYFLLLAIFVLYLFNKTDILLCILFSCMILSITNFNLLSRFFSSKPIFYLGLISYSMYLNHMVFLRILNHSFKLELWQPSTLNIAMGFFFFTACTILFSSFTYVYIERYFSGFLPKIIKVK